jgi:hypothetical protein
MNYKYGKRQRELDKKVKKEEKKQRKLNKNSIPLKDDPDQSSDAEIAWRHLKNPALLRGLILNAGLFI